jgi:L-methionine (R)-S-oxide reductase
VQRALTDHKQVLDEVRAAIDAEQDCARAMEATVRLLRDRMSDYDWVGIYLLYGNELALGPFAGDPSPHTRIPLGRGICGAAATEKTTIIGADKKRDVLGEIDIDSDRLAAFGVADRNLLEAIAALLAPRLARA